MAHQRIRDERHLRHVAKQDCCCDISRSENGSRMPDMRSCRNDTVVSHHIMYAEPSAMGLRSGDNYTVPLCAKHHADLHLRGDERLWWSLHGIDPILVAARLYQETLNFRAKTPLVKVVLPNKGKKTRSTKLLGGTKRE